MINILISPVDLNSGLTSISLGLLRALDEQGFKVGYLKPIAPDYNNQERSTAMVEQITQLAPPQPMQLSVVQQQVSQGNLDQVLEDVVTMHAQVANDGFDVVIIEGLVPDRSEPYTAKLNIEISKALNSNVLFVCSGLNTRVKDVADDLCMQVSMFGKDTPGHLGCIINKAGCVVGTNTLNASPFVDTSDPVHQAQQQLLIDAYQELNIPDCPIMGVIPWRRELASVRMLDIAKAINAKHINTGELSTRRVVSAIVCASQVPNWVDHLRPNTLVITPGDREDVLIACAMATLNGTPLAGVLLTANLTPSEQTQALCQQAMSQGLPILSTEQDTLTATQNLSALSSLVPLDDEERMQRIMKQITKHLDTEQLVKMIGAPSINRMSPAAFRYQLVKKARANKQRIVLPEGDEPRTIRAAAKCQKRGIAQCILLGDPERIRQIAQAQDIALPEDLTLLNPEDVREQYVAPMVELRKHKQLTEPMALSQLEDNVVLGTMMLATDEVDGLVSGAVHTTANTIRPALQLIKTAPSAKLVSSVFFMGLPDQVLVYGDCAVNPDPSADELADIAVQSTQSAIAMGIEPKVAMLSYSTGQSGSGADVIKVREATELVKQHHPDILVDGPLQYDAATTKSVAKSKAPNSAVAGQATVLIFPDLNTGNTTYKAVQRSAGVISIGPMLQGLAKPVNDLSRGALVEDIVYTIALTAIQAQHLEKERS